jgi:hypothetical protein
VTVHEGRSTFRLNAVIAPPNGGARAVTQNATSNRTQTSSTAQSATQRQTAPNAGQPNAPSSAGAGTPSAASQNLKYPFKLLEIHENDEIPPAPVAPMPPT